VAKISSGFRPGKPENAEKIGISESLWKLIQKCLEGDKTRRPQIKEVTEGVASAADNCHVFTPASAMPKPEMEVVEEESELLDSEFLLSFLVVAVRF